MKMKRVKRITAKFVAVAMVMLTAAGIGIMPEKPVNAAEPLSSYKNVEYGIKYTGKVDAEENTAANAWDIQYFTVPDKTFETGDVFYLSAKISGASSFKQAAIQTSVNNWDWSSAPKKWSEDGIADGTVVAGMVTATKDGDNVAFKIQLDNAVDADTTSSVYEITLTDLYIMPMSKGTQESVAMPENKLLSVGTKYSGTVAAEKNEDNEEVYEAQYFNVKDSAFSTGDTYIISYKLGGATQFKQVATQSSLNGWGWADAVKVWSGDGLAQTQNVTGAMEATSSGDGVAFKIRLDTLVADAETPGTSMDLTLTDLIVVKVSNNEVASLPSSLVISKDRTYEGSVNAVKDGAKWVVEYFNVTNSTFKKDDLIELNFTISGASAFKQLAVQSNLDGWAWDSAPKIWKNDGVSNDTKFSAIIKATRNDEDGIAFKLWLDNPVDADYSETPVALELKDLQIKNFSSVESLNAVYDPTYFTVGAAVSADKLDNAAYRYRVKEAFGSITAENAMKPDALLNKTASQNATDGKPVLNLQYSGMTKVLDFAKENNLKVRGHALVYGAQTPDWFFKVGYQDDGALVSDEVMTERLDSYIKQVVQFVETNYPGVVTSWDVVNEALNNDGSYVQNNWTETIGNSYVAEAFRITADYVKEDGVKLYYNDYNMEEQGKRAQVISIANDAPVDGVGMQEHVNLTYPTTTSIASAIDAYKIAGLDVQITELDVQIDESDTLQQQANRYAALFNVFVEKKDAITNVSVWGVNDGDSWKNQKRPLLFFDDLSPKPAYTKLLNLLNK